MEHAKNPPDPGAPQTPGKKPEGQREDPHASEREPAEREPPGAPPEPPPVKAPPAEREPSPVHAPPAEHEPPRGVMPCNMVPREEMIDETIDASFPASDPPAWTSGGSVLGQKCEDAQNGEHTCEGDAPPASPPRQTEPAPDSDHGDGPDSDDQDGPDYDDREPLP